MPGLVRQIVVVLVMAGALALAPAYAQSPSGAAGPTIYVEPSDASSVQPAADATSESATELAKKLQNPIGDLISVPFQNNTNFDVGPHNGTANRETRTTDCKCSQRETI
jgi:hypothetical protein